MDERSLRSCRILIVDDQVSSICLLVNILGRMGYHHIRSLTEPAKIFDELAAHPADLIVLDLCMPLFDGVQVMEQLKNAGAPLSDIPILVVTGDASPFNKRRALAAGATDLLQKPFDSSELMMRIRNLLQARLLRQELNNYALMLERMVDERTRELDAALTELRATQLQVVQQERLRAFSEMASGIVHDFNNALMSVTGYTELLLTDTNLLGAEHKQAREFLQIIHTTGRDAARVVERLREFYRPRGITDVFNPLDANKLVEEIASVTQPKWKDQALLDGRRIQVFVDQRASRSIMGDPSDLREVGTNLVFNAVDAMPRGGSIWLRTYDEGDSVVVEVEDSGHGMTPEVRQRCLEPFFSTKGDKGTGLGLSMVFGIIQRHDGELEIDSEEGQGTTFRIRFKAAAADAEVVTVPPAGNVPPLRVLVVDDESVPRDVLSRYLTEDGHTVVAVDSGEAAVAQFESQDFDLLLTDYAMPTMNGPELAKRFVKRRPAAPVIVVTGFGGTELEEESKPEGVKLVLHKPVHLRALRAALADVCGVLR